VKKLEDDQQKLLTLMIQLTRKLEMATDDPKKKRNKTIRKNFDLPIIPPLPVDIDQ